MQPGKMPNLETNGALWDANFTSEKSEKMRVRYNWFHTQRKISPCFDKVTCILSIVKSTKTHFL